MNKKEAAIGLCPAGSRVVYERNFMISRALLLLIIAVAVGVVGFALLDGTLALVARALFLIFFVLSIVSALGRGIQGKTP